MRGNNGDGGNGGNATDSGGYVELDSNAPPSQYGSTTVDGGTGAAPGSEGTISIDPSSGGPM